MKTSTATYAALIKHYAESIAKTAEVMDTAIGMEAAEAYDRVNENLERLHILLDNWETAQYKELESKG